MTHNPYAPPIAPVADSNTAAAIVRPWQVKFAVYLFWASFALGLLGFVLVPESTGISSGEPLGLQVIVGAFVVVTLAFVCLLIVCIGWGHRWARIVYAALVLWGCISGFQAYGEILARSWAYVAV